jgi:UTP--glucose-1-phosphate uridylyltransferase
MSFDLTKAVIPAAGLGSRMHPLTQGAPKEMLPVAGKPMIHHVVAEAVAAGIKEICIVIRRGKESIVRYFEHGELPYTGIGDTTQVVQLLTERCKILFSYQAQPKGLGDAILCARDFVGRERFGLLIPDQLFVGHASPLTQLTNRGYPANAAISSLVRIPPDELSYFSNARSFRYDTMKGESNVVLITGIEQAQCDPRSGLLRGFGRTIYPPHVFQFLGREFANPVTREVDLFRTFQALLTEVPNYGVFLEGEAFDLGTVSGYYYFRTRMPPSSP